MGLELTRVSDLRCAKEIIAELTERRGLLIDPGARYHKIPHAESMSLTMAIQRKTNRELELRRNKFDSLNLNIK